MFDLLLLIDGNPLTLKPACPSWGVCIHPFSTPAMWDVPPCLSYSNSIIVCGQMSYFSYSCLFLRRCAFGHVHLQMVSFRSSLLLSMSLVTVFMHPLLSTIINHFLTCMCVFAPSLIISSLKLSSLASPTCWQRRFCCIQSGTIHLFLVVISTQKL